MVGRFILRGIIVGIIAGLLTFGYAKTFGESSINASLQFEAAKEDAERVEAIATGKTPEPEEAELFSRDIQSGVGLLTGLVGVGGALGAIFGVVFATAYGRLGAAGPKATAALLSLLGLVSIYVVPALKYPASPPGASVSETIKLRTALYFMMVAISLAATLVALFTRGWLAKKFGAWNASVMATGLYLVVLFTVFIALPDINEVPGAFPASALWNFRVASMGVQIVLWGSLGILFGYLNGVSKRA